MPIKNDANRRAVAKYRRENYDPIQVNVKKGQREVLKAHAEAMGESFNAWCQRALWETMERDKSKDDA